MQDQPNLQYEIQIAKICVGFWRQKMRRPKLVVRYLREYIEKAGLIRDLLN